MTGAESAVYPSSVALPVAPRRERFVQIGFAERGHAAVVFELPRLRIDGRKVYLLERTRGPDGTPLADALAGKPVSLVNGIGEPVGRAWTSRSGRLLILDIDGAPSNACIFRYQFVRHLERGEATPVRAFPGEGPLWEVSGDAVAGG